MTLSQSQHSGDSLALAIVFCGNLWICIISLQGESLVRGTAVHDKQD